MRIVFFGTPDLAVPTLSALQEHHEVAAVPDSGEGARRVTGRWPRTNEVCQHRTSWLLLLFASILWSQVLAAQEVASLRFSVSEPIVSGPAGAVNVGSELTIRGWYAGESEPKVAVVVNGVAYEVRRTRRTDIDEQFEMYPFRSGWELSIRRNALMNENSVEVFVNGVSFWKRTIVPLQPSYTGETSGAPPPFRIIYYNDTTNLEYLQSPYRDRGERFRAEFLESSVAEVSGKGVDAYFLQPGTGWVPWWQSKIESPAQYLRLRDTLGVPLSGFAQYLVEGGDIVGDFIETCRKFGMSPFVSIRLNDLHGVEFAGASSESVTAFLRDHPEYLTMTQLVGDFYARHPEFQFDPASPDNEDRIWNWSIPEAREHKLRLIAELCESYRFAGLELDYMRFPRFFNRSETTWEDRRAIMQEFVSRVRGLLDDSSGPNERRWLSVRIPAQLDALNELGLRVSDLVDAGVDMFTLSSFYFTSQEHDLDIFRELVPAHVGLYLEMTHSTSFGTRLNELSYDGTSVIRTEPSQFFTTAFEAYQQGADGISLFNFQYFRKHDGKYAALRGPFQEPPFELIHRLRKEQLFSLRHRHYYIEPTTDNGVAFRQAPRLLRGERAERFSMYMSKTHEIKESSITLAVAIRNENDDSAKYRATFNGFELTQQSRAEAFLSGIAHDSFRRWVAFSVPGDAVSDGWNSIAVRRRGADDDTWVNCIHVVAVPTQPQPVRD